MLSRTEPLDAVRVARAAHWRGQRGFSLVELMVALVVTLIVTLAAVSFIASIAQASSDNIRVTRLTQEMRALSEVMSREIRRARFFWDPIDLVGRGPDNPPIGGYRSGVEVSADRDCISFSYDDAPNDAMAPSVPTTIERRIFFDAADQGSIHMGRGTCTDPKGPVVRLSSREVRIASCPAGQPYSVVRGPFEVTYVAPYQVTITVQGYLRGGNNPSQQVCRAFSQTVFLRSGMAS